ncbi:MAG: rod-binding protein [Lachnospiraceae bacterium]|nr:rod-binding protein [Lachnospiraceae bacterium]
MDISTSVNINDYYKQLASSSNASALSSKLNSTDAKTASEDELMDVCKQFESYMLEQVYKNMEKTANWMNKDEQDNQLVDYFKDLTIQDIAKQATDQKSIGLAQMLYDQMKVNMGISAEQLEQNMAESGTVTAETESV